jgi:hypothetical protein
MKSKTINKTAKTFTVANLQLSAADKKAFTPAIVDALRAIGELAEWDITSMEMAVLEVFTDAICYGTQHKPEEWKTLKFLVADTLSCMPVLFETIRQLRYGVTPATYLASSMFADCWHGVYDDRERAINEAFNLAVYYVPAYRAATAPIQVKLPSERLMFAMQIWEALCALMYAMRSSEAKSKK